MLSADEWPPDYEGARLPHPETRREAYIEWRWQCDHPPERSIDTYPYVAYRRWLYAMWGQSAWEPDNVR